MTNALSARPRGDEETIVAETAYPADGSFVDLQSASRLILLIHGYNNSERAAREAFAKFHRHVRGDLPREQVWEFYWPGDHPEPFMSTLTYPVRVVIAPQVGGALARFLAGHRSADSVSIIAHSLGCRVALETAFEIARDPNYRGPRLEHIFLLAAAVPVAMCDRPKRRFQAPVHDSREHVFYSLRDIVLAAGFPRFQSAVGPLEEGEAVGYAGQPIDRWTSRTGVCLPHGKYWDSRRITRDVIRTLNTGSVPQSLPSRCLRRYPVKAAAVALRRIKLPRALLPGR